MPSYCCWYTWKNISNGYGIEGSSHKIGLFSDTVVAYEIVLADGTLVRATKDNEYSDIYYAIPWSQGTLGLLVAAEIRLIPTKEYMNLTYKPVVGNLRDIAQAYSVSFAPKDRDQDNNKKIPDFVEGMVYSPTHVVMMTGRYASKEETKKKGNKMTSVGWWFKPGFYQHAEKASLQSKLVIEEVFVRIAPTVSGVVDHPTVHNLLRLLLGMTRGQ